LYSDSIFQAREIRMRRAISAARERIGMVIGPRPMILPDYKEICSRTFFLGSLSGIFQYSQVE